MLKGYYTFFPHQTWMPNVNLYETEAAYLICVDLAGVDKQKIDVELIEQRVLIKGHRVVPSVEASPCAAESRGRARVHLMEIDHGAFGREIELPQNVERDKIVARYVDGMLWIELPKKA